jgi:hypothetical protein
LPARNFESTNLAEKQKSSGLKTYTQKMPDLFWIFLHSTNQLQPEKKLTIRNNLKKTVTVGTF